MKKKAICVCFGFRELCLCTKGAQFKNKVTWHQTNVLQRWLFPSGLVLQSLLHLIGNRILCEVNQLHGKRIFKFTQTQVLIMIPFQVTFRNAV